jgi:hypothetical protein
MVKNFLPKDMRDLEDIYYNPTPANSERKKKYQKYIDGEVMDGTRESEAKRMMGKFGESTKIPTSIKKTPDFQIPDCKIVYEITSIQYAENEEVTQQIRTRGEEDFTGDVDRAIEHAAAKDYSDFNGFKKIVVIFIDTVLAALCHYTELSASPDLIKKTIFRDSPLDCMIIAPLPSSISGELKYAAYAKEDSFVKALREKLPEKFQVFKI